MEKNRQKRYTILQRFKYMLKDSTDQVNDIIRFLSLENARILNLFEISEENKSENGVYKVGIQNLSEKDIKEIYDFICYFSDEGYEKMTRKARFKNWPNDALIIRLGVATFEYKEEKNRKKFLEENKAIISKFPKEVINNAKSLRDRIMNMRYNRYITIMYGNFKQITYQIPKTVYKEELPLFRSELLKICTILIANHGGMVVRLEKDNEEWDIFGVVAYNGKNWEPLSAQDMFDAHTNFGEIKSENNVNFIEILKDELLN